VIACSILGVLAIALAVHAFTDLREGYVYDIAVYPPLAVIAVLSLHAGRLGDAAEGAALCGGLLVFLVMATRGRGMGTGDPKIAAIIGAALGPSSGAIALAAAFVWGSAIAVVLIAARRLRWGARIAFAPFLALGAATAMGLAYLH